MYSTRDVLEFEAQDGAYTWYAVEPSKLYLTAVTDLLERGTITPNDFSLALTPRDQVCCGDLVRRNEVLEYSRKMFTLQMVEELGNGTCLHILNDPDFRLR